MTGDVPTTWWDGKDFRCLKPPLDPMNSVRQIQTKGHKTWPGLLKTVTMAKEDRELKAVVRAQRKTLSSAHLQAVVTEGADI